MDRRLRFVREPKNPASTVDDSAETSDTRVSSEIDRSARLELATLSANRTAEDAVVALTYARSKA